MEKNKIYLLSHMNKIFEAFHDYLRKCFVLIFCFYKVKNNVVRVSLENYANKLIIK